MHINDDASFARFIGALRPTLAAGERLLAATRRASGPHHPEIGTTALALADAVAAARARGLATELPAPAGPSDAAAAAYEAALRRDAEAVRALYARDAARTLPRDLDGVD